MRKETIRKYQHFLEQALLIDQSRVVDSILTPETYTDHMNNIHNNEWFVIKLSSGWHFGSPLYLESLKGYTTERIQDSKQKIESTTSTIEKNNLFKLVAQLDEDLEKIESAVTAKRYIYNWLLVPYWMAKELKQMGEVVFDFKEAYYWGITAVSGEDSFQRTLYELFEELNFEQLNQQYDDQDNQDW